jgi:hypothetical protein
VKKITYQVDLKVFRAQCSRNDGDLGAQSGAQ